MPPIEQSETLPKPAAQVPRLPFLNSYAALPARFYTRQAPVPVAQPRLIKFNQALAAELGLGLESTDTATLESIFSGNQVPPGADPIAMAYAGHQFGQFVPQLGDGRAILLGEVNDRTGARRDIQLKGAGITLYSRNGDGRAAIGPVLREYLVSEAMHALGIPATRALAAVATGEVVIRETGLPGAILTRVAASHVRVGTFQYFAARGDSQALQELADYVTARHYPHLKSAGRPYLELLRAVCERQAQLVASWMSVGFIHGVMNTDNMAVSGETIDFGPCAFMDAYDPATVFSSIDSMGRYAYANQPAAAQWNLARFAETLLPLIDADANRAVESATEVIAAFAPSFQERWLAAMRAKMGLLEAAPGDGKLVSEWLDLMHRNQCDFTLTFRRLCAAANALPDAATLRADALLRTGFMRPDEYDAWAVTWRTRLEREPASAEERAAAMRRVNPAYVPRNHRVEQALAAAAERLDFGPFEQLLRVLSDPYREREEFAMYAIPPRPEERVQRTFCGT